ncbi:MAG: hypothetical protein KC619_01390 [Myxococcales bacterium]|nr:hypothetical protein [Myxococcales bacterium]
MVKSGSPPKRKKRMRKKKPADSEGSAEGMSTTKEAVRSGGGGGVMQSMRAGFKRAAGVEDGPEEKPSTLSNILWTLLLLAALGFLIYRWYG